MRLTMLLPLLLLILAAPTASATERQMQQFQSDADLARLEHLVYWTGLIEEYHAKTGQYPLQDKLTGEKPGLVRIATRDQQTYFNPQSRNYQANNDNNAGGRYFQEFTVKALVAELESKLGRDIVEKYDIQTVPTVAPGYYAYFPTKDGYLMWVACVSCGVTKISTLLMDGSVATVNIASPSMAPKVTKAMTRDAMLADPVFKKWQSIPYQKEGFVRMREQQAAHDSDGQ